MIFENGIELEKIKDTKKLINRIAIRINMNVVKMHERNPWVDRELFVLNQLNGRYRNE